ncbi:MAG: DUF2437 domain-containing protein, partial [Bifidobacteriaceae bacterium]|nr:DUF2437 domain-containing protein [Bifidobacteriaceae bacterium]
MRIARFTVDQDPVYGVVQGEEGEEVVHAVGGDPLYTEITPTGQTYDLQDVRLLAPVIPRSKLIGVAHNYLERPGAAAPRTEFASDGVGRPGGEEGWPGDGAAASNGAAASDGAGRTGSAPAPGPVWFGKPNTSVVGPGDPI